MPYASISRGTLRSRLQDHFSGDPFWTSTEANDALNEALRWWNLYTGFWCGEAQALTVAGTPYVPVPQVLTWQTRVRLSTGPALLAKGILELYRSRPGWRTQTTASGGGVPSRIEEWAPVGVQQIAIWPRDAGGTLLTFSGVLKTPVLLDDGQFLQVGEEQVGPLLDESLWVLGFKRPSLREQLQEGHTRFLQACLGQNDRLRRSAAFRKTLGLPSDGRLDRPARANTDLQEAGR